MTALRIPPSGRWTPQFKTAVCHDINRGQISPAEAIVRYGLSSEEPSSWLAGRVGLRALQQRRRG